MSQSNNLQSKIELRHDYIILKRKNVGKTAFSFRHFPTFYNRHLQHVKLSLKNDGLFDKKPYRLSRKV